MSLIRKKRLFIPIMVAIMIVMCWPVSANACSLMYVGGDHTDDGANVFIRTEEIGADDNKIYYVSPAENHKKGEIYQGCYGFTWEFTHDSYEYTARRDDNLSGECPDCESTHKHTPYEEAGTNDHGVTVSATQSIDANPGIKKADPFPEKGISEAEIATVLLSESSSARDGVDLLLEIYDTVGANGEGSGVMICDQNEQWYVENLSGHEYVAVRLPSNVCFLQHNIGVLGRIDLDDTDNVIASKHLISVAKKAGTFVGDEKKNIIDYRTSYNDYATIWDEEWKERVQERQVAGLNYLEGTNKWTKDNVLEDNDYIMTNVDEDGNITVLHNNLTLKDATMSLEDIFAVFRIYPIGHEENVNTHLYRFYPDKEQKLGTVEWFSMDNCMHTVYVPSYPMLLTDTWEGYKVGLDFEDITKKKPESGDYYLYDDEYHVHPNGWEKSYIATLSALSGVLTHGNLSEEQIELAEYNLRQKQDEFITRFDELQTQIAKESSIKAREEIMTQADMEMAEEVHDLALSLYRYYTYGEESDLIQDVKGTSPVVPIVIVIALLLVAAAGFGYRVYKGRQKRMNQQ
ncbi:MAG: C69 family dipeptidase [Firmicutes bacterium]|nr:C69 family dipeptidase [Bacillota bacterium]